MFGFRLPTRVHIRAGARRTLPDVLGALGVRRVLLAVDPGLSRTPWPDEVTALLDGARVASERFDAIEPNPRTSTAERAAAVVRGEKLEAVIGLGGGSVLDAAKAAAMLATNDGPAAAFAGPNRFASAPLPFIAMPTTCGTGSEVTWVSVLSDAQAGTKISVKGDGMFPTQALVDPDLITTLPRSLVTFTALDALTHAVEATTCRQSNPVSDALAETAIRLVFTFLPRACADIGGDAEARSEIMRAATIAGIAFGNADVASVHCLSEALGGMFDVPHGLTNAILLAPMLRANRPWIDLRLAALRHVVDPGAGVGDKAEDADGFLDSLDSLVRRLEVPVFSSLGVAESAYPAVARRAAENGSNPSNARPLTALDYEAILGTLE